MVTKNIKWLFAVCVLLLSSCSLQKRLYNKGFYVSKHHSNKQAETKPDTDTLPSVLSSIKTSRVKEISATLSAEASNLITKNSTFNTQHSTFLTGCDTLVLRNGTKILAKVSEINPTQIKYRYCNAPEETHRKINITDVNYIVYSSGRKEVFEAIESSQNQVNNNQHKARVPAIVGFVFLMLSFLLLILLFVPSLNIGFAIGAIDLLFALLLFIAGIILLIVALVISISTKK